MTSSKNSTKADQPRKRFRRTRATARFMGTWLTPFGVLRGAHQKYISSRSITPETRIEDPARERIENLSAIIASLIGLAGCAWVFIWLSDYSADRSTLSIIGIIILMMTLLLGLKLRRHVANLMELRRRRIGDDEYGQDLTKEEKEALKQNQNDELVADDQALAVLLFRFTTWRNVFLISATFAVCLFFTPQNIAGIRKWHNLQSSINIPAIVALTYLFLLAVLLISALRAHKDVQAIKAKGASPIVEGYVTVNNNILRLLGFTASAILVAAVGDGLLHWLGDNNVQMGFAAISRIIVTIYMITFGINTLRSTSTISGLQTARSRGDTRLLNIFIAGSCALPAPTRDQPLMTLPVGLIRIIAMGLFGVGLWVASNNGALAMITVVAGMGPLALVAAVLEFHPQLQERESSEDGTSGVRRSAL